MEELGFELVQVGSRDHALITTLTHFLNHTCREREISESGIGNSLFLSDFYPVLAYKKQFHRKAQ